MESEWWLGSLEFSGSGESVQWADGALVAPADRMATWLLIFRPRWLSRALFWCLWAYAMTGHEPFGRLSEER